MPDPKKFDESDPEFQALKGSIGDVVGNEGTPPPGGEGTPPPGGEGTPPPGGEGTPPPGGEGTPPPGGEGTPPPGGEGTPPPGGEGTPPPGGEGTPPPGGEGTPPPGGEGTPPPSPSTEEIRMQVVNEIFGDQFKSFDDVKKAKITDTLKEVSTLREANATFKSQAEGRPFGYANESIALFNEFVKKTGIQNYEAFNKLMNTDLSKLGDVEVMVLKEITDKPKFIGQESKLKAKFEKQYKVDDEEMDTDELEINKISLASDAETARQSLTELKGGVKLPEETPPTPPPGGPVLTDEQKTQIKNGWENLTKEIGDKWKSYPLTPTGRKVPILNYEIPAETKQNLISHAKDFCIENQMELNEENVKQVFSMMQRDLVADNLPAILHAVSEKVRSLTAEEWDKFYENPSGSGNTDIPPAGTISDQEQQRDEIYQAEKENISGPGQA